MPRARKKSGEKKQKKSKLVLHCSLSDQPKIFHLKRDKNSDLEGCNLRNVASFPYSLDNKGNLYIPVCGYPIHPGIVLEGDYDCIKRECRYFKTAFPSKPDFNNLK